MDSDKPRKPGMTSLKTRPLERNIALTKLGLGAGTKIVGHTLMNIFRGEVEKSAADREFYRKQAGILADELGRLKGSVMKAGQMLSLFGEYFLPEEANEVLASLQDDTPPVDWRVVGPVLEKSLGPSRLAELDIDREPIAAASLGQAHRARRRADGLELVVKIQYPGVAESIDSDIRTLSRLLLMTRLAPQGFDLGPTFAEVKDMLLSEVDYAREADYTEDFARRLAGSPHFVVPRVLREYSTGRVLTLSYESGVAPRMAEAQTLSQARRNRLCQAYFELSLTEFFDWGMIQSDPNFGNYRIRVGERPEDDRLVLLDFGAVRHFQRPFIEQYAALFRGALLRDRPATIKAAIDIGLMQRDFPERVLQGFADMCELIVEPFAAPDDPRIPPECLTAAGEYRWGKSSLPMRLANVAARNALSKHFRVPPPAIVFLHRRLGGVFVLLAHLGAELKTREAVLAALHLDPP